VFHLRSFTPIKGKWLPQLSITLGCGDEQTLQQTYFRANGSARCVQNFDDSLSFAIRITYRISLRSSSLWEPRHPLLKVFYVTSFSPTDLVKSPLKYNEFTIKMFVITLLGKWIKKGWAIQFITHCKMSNKKGRQNKNVHGSYQVTPEEVTRQLRCGNDPSAGSPTETLLRLHLPLNDEV
jgi:hypothetical protein